MLYSAYYLYKCLIQIKRNEYIDMLYYIASLYIQVYIHTCVNFAQRTTLPS